MSSSKQILFLIILTIISSCAEAPIERDPAATSANSVDLKNGQSEFSHLHLLGNNEEAYIAKMNLINSATKYLDLTYFIIDDDPSTARMMQKIIGRANNGTQVRILVDYFMSQKQLPMLLLLSQNKNIKIKRFRPPSASLVANLKEQGINANRFLIGLMYNNMKLISESIKGSTLEADIQEELANIKNSRAFMSKLSIPVLVGMAKKIKEQAELLIQLRDFLKRSHHKLILANQHCFVMGGRNLSDEYHANKGNPLLAKRSYAFQDTDISGCTSSFQQINSFNRLWSSPLAVDVNKNIFTLDMTNKVVVMTPDELQKSSIQASSLAKNIKLDPSGSLPNLPGYLFENLQGDIQKDSKNGRHDITSAYIERIKKATETIDIVSAYFCVGSENKEPRLNEMYSALIEASRDRGVKVNIYTNSFTSTDLNMVNKVAFLKYREIIGAGIKIHELAPDQGSLHTKAAAFDEKYLLVGSYNMDPRSHVYDTNNLLQLEDLTKKSQLSTVFRKTRINTLKWNEADLVTIDSILKERASEVKKFTAVRELL